MNAPIRNLLLSAVLIAVPASGFALVEHYLLPGSGGGDQTLAHAGLGDLSAYSAIVSDTQKIAAGGDLSAAERRITDLETLWDQNAGDLRRADPGAWGAVDSAADEAFSALRARVPDPARVDAALAALQRTLAAPVPAAANQPIQLVAGIPVTDATGRPLPCEGLIGQVRTALAGRTPPAAVADLQSKALERCNADDDARANAFSAQALAEIRG